MLCRVRNLFYLSFFFEAIGQLTMSVNTSLIAWKFNWFEETLFLCLVALGH